MWQAKPLPHIDSVQRSCGNMPFFEDVKALIDRAFAFFVYIPFIDLDEGKGTYELSKTIIKR